MDMSNLKLVENNQACNNMIFLTKVAEEIKVKGKNMVLREMFEDIREALARGYHEVVREELNRLELLVVSSNR